ncbi:hypothetical protein HDG34_003303 [Paraburkholderia sp. HC6.4b]|uniref:Replication protein O n=1 Tax=unclassified Paraburkholderia TaxID=2615204 RepID=UPI001615F9BC|nr:MULTISPECIES: Replication protein O [unclassified Paraburkholderia]MBB5409362.1 hypothetical protein [Paraburkholderia sp. HC6.4b]MBB5451090.1 hypothetical protein [Paraburkholderia sp. Kb1A]
MSIAQHFVAGEGSTHPSPAHSDQAALSAFQCDTTNLPWVIFRAAFRANHIDGISQRARALLSALARTVDADRPFASIFARRELLTGRALQSMRTLYRALHDLETAGLVERRPQNRYVEAGLFGRAYLHLTQQAAELLGLVEERPAPVVPATADAGGSDEGKGPDQANGPCATVAHGAIYKDLYPASLQKRQPGQVPADLQRLRSLGFSDFLIFKLMRQARDAGKRLSDVVEVTWQHLKAAKRPICYLGALLRNPVDFSHQLRQRSQASAEAEARRQRAVEAQAVAKQSAGKVFEDVDRKLRYSVDASGEHLSVYSHEEGIERQATNWQAGFATALAGGRLREAVPVGLATVAMSFARTEPRVPVTPATRAHIAGIWDVLKPGRKDLKAGPKNEGGRVRLESLQPHLETTRVIASPV